MTPNGEVALAILGALGVIVLLSLMGAYLIIGMAWERSPLRTGGTGDPERISGWKLVGEQWPCDAPSVDLVRFSIRVFA